MTAAEAVLVYLGLPILFAILVAALVSAKSWTRGGRTGADYASSPLLLTSPAAVPDPSRMSGTNDVSAVGGGVSAQW